MYRLFLFKFLNLSFALILLSPISALAAFRIFIDPGHGGKDEPGAISNGATESQIVLKISKDLLELIQKNPEFEAQLSRTQDQQLSLEDRIKAAQSFNTNLFVSIHANSSPSTKNKGTEFYFQNTLPATEESLYLANLENQFYEKETQLEKSDEDLTAESELAAIMEDLKVQRKLCLSFSQCCKKGHSMMNSM